MKKLSLLIIVILTACQSTPSTEANQEVVDLAADIITDQLHDTLKLEITEVFRMPGGCCVGDYDHGRVVCTDMDLKAKLVFGSKGQGPGELMSPQASMWYKGKFYIFDFIRNGIEIFDENGQFEREVRTPAEYDKWSQFALYGSQSMIFSTGYRSSVGLVFDLSKLKVSDSFGSGEKPDESIVPANMHITQDSNVIAVLLTEPRVLIYNRTFEKQSEKDITQFSFISEIMKYHQENGFKKEDIPQNISSSAFDPVTRRLYLMTFAFYPEKQGPFANVLYEFQYENAQLSLRNTYRLKGAEGNIPAFLAFTIEKGKVFAWDSYNQDFYRYSLPD